MSARSAFAASNVDCEAENQLLTSPSAKGAERCMNRAWTGGIANPPPFRQGSGIAGRQQSRIKTIHNRAFDANGSS